MDVQPRHMRALKVYDENAPAALPAGKMQTLHQRNKSTPVLSTLAQLGGLKAAAKRTAFADVSNVVRNSSARDDLAVHGKALYDPVKDKFTVPVNDFAKPAGNLQRPAQRPLSALIRKPLATQPLVAPLPHENVVASEPEAITQPPMHKVVTKRATTIFREPVEVLPQPSRSSISVAPVHQLLSRPDAVDRERVAEPEPKQELEPVREPEPALIPELSAVPELPAIPELAAIPELSPLPELSVLPELSAIPDEGVKLSDDLLPVLNESDVSSQDYVEQLEEAMKEGNLAEIKDEYDAKPVVAEAKDDYVEILEEQARLIEQKSRELAQLTRPEAESQEYWDEDDDQEFYEAEGYTTARSVRSRGDNTTGGITLPVLAPTVTSAVEKELELARIHVEQNRTPDEIDDELWDTSMVAEYGDEIFEYMHEIEERMRPNPYYMDNQTEIQWSMRSVLIDWVVQVHHRFNLLPETLFLCINYIDRFLSVKVVSLGKLQLVGATALFVAAKYEEINCPSVQEMVYMVDGGYSVSEILKAERFMLSMLQFELGWPGPMSFLRRISKADDYDLETRTLAKYFLEISIMDERFVSAKPSYLSAGAHCLARSMLKKGDWTLSHVHYSGYTLSQLKSVINVLLECLENPTKHHQAIYNKYTDKRYKGASLFAEGEIQRGFAFPWPAKKPERCSLASELSSAWRIVGRKASIPA